MCNLAGIVLYFLNFQTDIGLAKQCVLKILGLKEQLGQGSLRSSLIKDCKFNTTPIDLPMYNVTTPYEPTKQRARQFKL